MRILVYASEANAAGFRQDFEASLPDGCEFEIAPAAGFPRSFRKKAPGALVYLDAAGMGIDRLIDSGAQLDELGACAWAVLDREGSIDDPAALFHAGASDYLGPKLLRNGASKTGTMARKLGKAVMNAQEAEAEAALGAGRLLTALAYGGLIENGPEEEDEGQDFPGWEGIAEGTDTPVRFCYAALGRQHELLERIGEKRLQKLREDFATYLANWAQEGNGIVWIRDNGGCLVLFPPLDHGSNPVNSAYRLLLDRALVGYEAFRMEIPITFRFAFHKGRTMWRKPGSTGTVISEDVNFIFHLGAKAGVDGAILVSAESEQGIHPGIRDLFSTRGEFEGRVILGSKRFQD